MKLTHKMRPTSKWILLGCLIAACLTLIDCAATLELLTDLNYTRFYSGSSEKKSDVAFLTHKNPYSKNIIIYSINGKQIIPWGDIIELLPGHYTVLASYMGANYHSTKSENVEFDASPGRIYIIYPRLSEDNKKGAPLIEDITDQTEDKSLLKVLNVVQKYHLKQQNKDELSSKSRAVLLEESFNSNKRNWTIRKNNDNYDAIFDNNRYVMQSKKNKCFTEIIQLPSIYTKNFDAELTCTWEGGVNNHGFGLVIGSDLNNYYNFSLSANGQAVVGLKQNGSFQQNPIKWAHHKCIHKNGELPNLIMIEFRGNYIRYYINKTFIGSFYGDLKLKGKECMAGVGICNKERVVFDNLKITGR